VVMSRFVRFTMATVFTLTGIGLAIAFMTDSFLSIGLSLALILGTAIVAGFTCAVTPLAILPRLLLLLYIMPFGVCVGYLSDPNHTWPLFANVLSFNYQTDLLLIRQLLMVGVIGIMGLAAGTLFGASIMRVARADDERPSARTFGPFLFSFALAVSL